MLPCRRTGGFPRDSRSVLRPCQRRAPEVAASTVRVLSECSEWHPDEWFHALTKPLAENLHVLASQPTDEKHCDGILANLTTLSSIVQYCDQLPVSRGGVRFFPVPLHDARGFSCLGPPGGS